MRERERERERSGDGWWSDSVQIRDVSNNRVVEA